MLGLNFSEIITLLAIIKQLLIVHRLSRRENSGNSGSPLETFGQRFDRTWVIAFDRSGSSAVCCLMSSTHVGSSLTFSSSSDWTAVSTDATMESSSGSSLALLLMSLESASASPKVFVLLYLMSKV